LRTRIPRTSTPASYLLRFFSLGPSVAETLFDGGLRRVTVAQYTAQYNADVAAYQQTVLTAFQQAEDSLAALRLLQTQLQQQESAVSAAQHYVDLATTRYRTGVDTYLNVLTARSSFLTAQRAAVNVRVQQMTNSVQLIEALGGGWDSSTLPTERAVSDRQDEVH
jgi:outer membrane protein TolC